MPISGLECEHGIECTNPVTGVVITVSGLTWRYVCDRHTPVHLAFGDAYQTLHQWDLILNFAEACERLGGSYGEALRFQLRTIL